MNTVFDIGGTNMRVASAEGRKLVEIRKVPTPKNAKEGIATLLEQIYALAQDAQIKVVAGCVAGNVNDVGEIWGARNLRDWEGINIVQELSGALKVPVRVVNDGGGVGLGEAYEGAGKGAKVLAYVTVSTGVGGARIVGGNIDVSGGVGDTPLDGSDLENLVSGTAVKKKFGVEPKNLESLEERNKLADLLARGLVAVIQKWQPDTIVLGGSMIVGINPIPLERVTTTLQTLLPNPPTVKMAQLGDNGGLIGAAILAERLSPGV